MESIENVQQYQYRQSGNRGLILLLLILPLAVSLTFPRVALADETAWWDIPGHVSDAVSDAVSDTQENIAEGFAGIFSWFGETLINSSLNNIKTTTTKSILGKSFENLLGKKTGGLYLIVTTVHRDFVTPIAASILSLVMLIQLVKISQRIDGTATIPAIKDIIFLVVYATIFIWLIKNSVDICAAVYDMFNKIINGITQVKIDDIESITVASSVSTDLGKSGTMFVIGLLMFLASWVIKGAVSIMCYMRALQLYVYTAFSPIPFALLGFDETKSYGISFCKNYLAIALSGAIIMLALSAFPSLLNFSGGEIKGIGGDLWGSLCAIIAMTMVIVKSGSIARDVLGG